MQIYCYKKIQERDLPNEYLPELSENVYYSQYLEKVSKIAKIFWSLTLFRPQSNNCLVRVRFAVKKRASERERGAFLFVEAIPFSRGYYMMLDMASIEIM